MKPILLLFLFLFLSTNLVFGQKSVCGHQIYYPHKSALDFEPCGNTSFKSEWLKSYQKNPSLYQKSPTATTYLPLSLHVVGNDDSTGYGSLSTILAAVCQANLDYKDADIQFFIEYPINYIPKTSFNSHSSPFVGGVFMQQNEVPNTTNVYFVDNPVGTCGYTLPYAGIAINYSCLGDHSLSHELGHAFSLPHTFNGWEGGYTSTGATVTNFTNAAPDTIYKQKYEEDTIAMQWSIVEDTVAVELVARTNCSYAGDGFCDTEADYLAFRWACNASNMSNVQQIDPDTVSFFSNGNNIMSYSMCQSTFSSEQKAAMNAYIQTEKSNHLYNQNPNNDSIALANLSMTEPINGSTNTLSNNVTFRWSSVPGATHYFLKICASPCNSSNLLMEEILLTDTFYNSPINYPPRIAIFPYRWQVMPFNQGNTCVGLSSAHTFNTTNPTGFQELSTLQSFQVYPNPIINGQSLQLEINASKNTVSVIKIYSTTGQLLDQKEWALATGNNQLSWKTKQLTAGLYLIHLESDLKKIITKLIIL